MICVLMNSNSYVENLGKRNDVFFVLIDPKRHIREDTGIVMKVKTHIQNALLKLHFLSNLNVVFN